ncbi:RNA methyltransferase, TrmA family [Thermoanaerobacter italicus Ab9]|uniref:RNA methyltransferase, TrmA family n=2 Tax=Thermoanaerobacter TaxID=1754 RepID=D3T3P5_THEIA|nr:23S rRNA (uracil(1939)-C(5))-methyltransferase RlmD [Thermoanaerobacter italicus]ADD02847.1 RNA methyltransferase, TrmA family [Thermoanaerobacter italicus Ab9]
MKKNDIITVEIKEMEFGGFGIGYYDGKRVKIKGAFLGQKIKAKIKKIKKEILEAETVEIVENSPLEKESLCPLFGDCGGCTYQNVDYLEQLKIKENIVKKLLEKEGIKDYKFLGIVKSPKEHGYRNKMEYTFGKDKEGNAALGLHRKGRFYEVIMTDKCNIVDGDFIKALTLTFDYAINKRLPFYDKKTHEGFLRHLVVRKASKSREILLNIVTTTQLKHDFTELIEIYKNANFGSHLVGVLHTQNDSWSDAVVCERLEVLYGRDYLIEEILDLKFKISAFSFFQTNSYGAEKLYETVREFAGDVSDKIVFDLYSGTGTIGIIMAPMAKKVIGIELVEEAVMSARENAKLNGLKNCTFIAGDVSQKLKEIKEQPDVVIVDPPRSGINPKALKDIVKFNPQKVVYVSCNPESLARDLKVFSEGGYKVDKVKCVDMFPYTYHVETVVLMEKK